MHCSRFKKQAEKCEVAGLPWRERGTETEVILFGVFVNNRWNSDVCDVRGISWTSGLCNVC